MPAPSLPSLRRAQRMKGGRTSQHEGGPGAAEQTWMGTRQRSSVESVTVLWPVRVWVSVQGFHVNVQGWEWETPSLEDRVGLPVGSVSVPGCVQGQELGAPHHGPSSPWLPHPQWMVAMPATWPPAWQHPNMGGHHRFTRGILRGRGKMRSQEPGSRPKQKEKLGFRGHSWS